MKKCLITGASGLVGQELLKELVNFEIFSIGFPGEIDLTDPYFTEKLPKKMDYIVHLAQSDHFRNFPEKAEDIFNVNTISTLKLLEYGRKVGVKSFIYTSSGAVYGHSSVPMDESDPLIVEDEMGFYRASKLSSEMLVKNYKDFFNTMILRPFFIYGPHQQKHMLIPRLVESVKEKRPIKLNGPDGIKINPLNVKDAAKSIYAALRLEGSHTINIGGPEILSLREIGEMIGNILEIDPIFETDSTIPNSLIGNINKMKDLLIDPQIDFKEGIKDYVRDLGYIREKSLV